MHEPSKVCLGCAQELPLTAFSAYKLSPDGHKARCRPCRQAQERERLLSDPKKLEAERARCRIKQQRKYAADPISAAAKMRAWRVAQQCLKPLPTEEEIARKAAESRQRKREARKRTYEKNKASVLAQAAEYRAAHKDQERAARAAHYQRNKARVAEAAKAYRLAHPDLYAEADARRRAAELRATPAWVERAALASFYIEASRLTRETGERYEVDHIVPLQSKLVCGLHCPANLRVVPRSVNRSKSNKLLAAE